MHLFGPASRYPVAADTRYVSQDALPETYIALMDRFGIAMAVFVPASPHGTDPSHLIDVLRRYPDRFRGVAILDADPDIGTISKLAAAGVKGVRFQSAAYGSALPGLSLETAARIHEFGWHVQLYPSGSELVELEPLIRAVRNKVVIDHFGAMPAAGGVDQPAFKALLRLLDTGRVWVKLSRPSQLTREDPPYPSVTPLARALVRHAPERLLWATDWPHVGMVGRAMPDDGDLVDLLLDWVPDETVRNRILADNPDAFYELDGAARRISAGTGGQGRPTGT
jgi:predicted TIM-barrel fold metal-dependent hydrolase